MFPLGTSLLFCGFFPKCKNVCFFMEVVQFRVSFHNISLFLVFFLVLGLNGLRLPKKKAANGQKCPSLWGAKLWNFLPVEPKTASSLNGFKKSIKG